MISRIIRRRKNRSETSEPHDAHDMLNDYTQSMINHSRLIPDIPHEATDNPIDLEEIVKEGQTGDILMFRGVGLLAGSIQAVTKGVYSHASILIRGTFEGQGKRHKGITFGQEGVLQVLQVADVGDFPDLKQYENGKCVYTDGGVTLCPLEWMYPQFLTLWGELGCWQRLQVPAGKRSDVDRDIKDFAGQVMGKPYDGGIVHMNLISCLKGIYDIDDERLIRNKYYCSSLVAASLEWAKVVKKSNVLSYTPGLLGDWVTMNAKHMEKGFSLDAPRLVQVALSGPYAFRKINIYDDTENHNPELLPEDNEHFVYPKMSDLATACVFSDEAYLPQQGVERSHQISIGSKMNYDNVYTMVTKPVRECVNNKLAGIWKCPSTYHVLAFTGAVDKQDFVEEMRMPGWGVLDVLDGLKKASGYTDLDATAVKELLNEGHAHRPSSAGTRRMQATDEATYEIGELKGYLHHGHKLPVYKWKFRADWGVEVLKAAMDKYPDARWLVTGHSLGGTLAITSSRALEKEYRDRISMCIAVNPVVTPELYVGICEFDRLVTILHATSNFTSQQQKDMQNEFNRRSLEILVHTKWDDSKGFAEAAKIGHSVKNILDVFSTHMDIGVGGMQNKL